MKQAPSVTRRLMLAVAVPLLLFLFVTSVGLDYLYRDLASRTLDDMLDQQMVSLLGAVEPTPSGDIDVRLLDPESRLITPASGHYAEVSSIGGGVLWRSPSLIGVGLNFGEPLMIGVKQQGMTNLGQGGEVRVLRRGLRWDEAPGRSRELIFSVAESLAPYNAQLRTFRQVLSGWFLFLTVALLLTVGILARRALNPLRRLEAEIAAVESGQSEQLGEGYPRELAGTAGNLNALLHSERRRIARYRDTLGNLAHELKTPLAVARQALRSEVEPRAAVDREIERMVNIVDRQLTRAATGGAVTVGQSAVAVAPIVTDLRVSLLRVHARKDLSIAMLVSAEVGFVGDQGDLTELLGNLLDNACKWCRATVRLTASLNTSSGLLPELELAVEDDGPGVAPGDRERVLSRGARADESTPGHGLGLAIARDTIAAYSGQLRIESSADLGGACIRVVLPGRALAG